MLGKGLESLIPPQSGSGGKGQPPPSDDAAKGAFAGEGNANNPVRKAAGDFVPGGGRSSENTGRQFAGDDFRAAIYAKPPGGSERDKPRKLPPDSIFHIEVAKIKPNPNQPRRNFDEKGLWELANSVREFGFLQPLIVSKEEKEISGGVEVGYQLIAGERRLLAAKLLGLESVPAIIRNVDLEREKLELAVVENIQRENLSPIERARAISRLQEEFRLTQREIAAKLGKSREVVANTARLLDLPMYIQEALGKNEISESHGRFLLAIKEPGAQKRLFEDLKENRLTTRELKNRVRLAKKPAKGTEGNISPETKMMEEKLSTELGAPVKIEKGTNNGKIVIMFYSEEELENIVQRIGGGEAA